MRSPENQLFAVPLCSFNLFSYPDHTDRTIHRQLETSELIHRINLYIDSDALRSEEVPVRSVELALVRQEVDADCGATNPCEERHRNVKKRVWLAIGTINFRSYDAAK